VNISLVWNVTATYAAASGVGAIFLLALTTHASQIKEAGGEQSIDRCAVVIGVGF
jgi:hypothetical protein